MSSPISFSKEQLQAVEIVVPSVLSPEPLGKFSSIAQEASCPTANGLSIHQNGSKEPFQSDDELKCITQYLDLYAPNEAPTLNGEVQQGAVMPIAVIGMSCRLPGDASNPHKLWDLCSEGRSAWSVVPAEKFNVDAFYHPDPERTDAV